MTTATTTAVREHPVNLQPWEVRSILRGWKTQLRRPIAGVPEIGPNSGLPIINIMPSLLINRGDLWDVRHDGDNPRAVTCPFGAAGDRLWVRESFGYAWLDDAEFAEAVASGEGKTVYYRANWSDSGIQPSLESRWLSASVMPRWASRLTLGVESVRAHRLHDLTAEDAAAEFAHEYISSLDDRAWDIANERWCRITKMLDPAAKVASRKAAFVLAWDRRFRDTPWKSNPWVWAVTFRRVEA